MLRHSTVRERFIIFSSAKVWTHKKRQKGGRGAVKKHGASPDFFRGRYNEPFPKCVAVTVVSGQFYREFSISHRKYLL